ncbi:hypothetical protein WJX77_006142 [Trebouxia sp. C0004]
MFAKLQRQIDRKNKHKSPKKFRFDVTVSSLEGIPATIKGCRIVWTRGSRSQTTQTTPVINGVAHWREPLSQVSTIYTDPKHTADVEEKEYVFKVQATTQHGHDEDRLITVGKVKINMAQFATLGHKEHHTVLQMPFSAGKSFTQALPFGQLRLKISAHMVKHVGENDEISEVSSGLGASTVDSRHHEQDLAGFPEVENSRNSVTAHVAESAREEADAPAALVPSPSKFAARESSGEAQAIGTSVHPTSEDMQTDKEARERQAAQQEVVALRARVHQLESDTHSSSSLELKNLSLRQQERDHMEHKLDELQQQGSRLGPANLANHDQISQLQHEVLQLTAENEELEQQVQELTQQAGSNSDSARIHELESERKLAEERIAELESQLNAAFGGASAALSSRPANTDTAQARIAELEAQIEAMIEQMPSDQPQSSDQVAELKSETAAAQSRIAELESQVEAMIEQIGSSADAAVIALEQDIVHLKKELHDAQRDSASAQAAAAEADALLQEAGKEREAFKMQAEQLAKHLQLEQQKAEQDRAKWARKEADMQHSLQETMSTSQRLQDAKDSAEQEHSNLHELHRQLMAELQQRNGQALMSLEPSRSKHSDLEEQLEASHAEMAHMQQQIAATTAAVATARGADISQAHYSAPGDPDYSEDSLIRQLTDEMNLELEQRRKDFEQRSRQLEDQSREIGELKVLLESQTDLNASLQRELQEGQQKAAAISQEELSSLRQRVAESSVLRTQLEAAQQEAAHNQSRAKELYNQLDAMSRRHEQELQGLAEQLTGLQHQLQDSTLEVQRLEEEAGALDHKAVQLQLELDQAQRAHSNAQQQLQESHEAAVQDRVQQAVAVAVSSRDDDMVILHQQLDESEAHFQAELDDAHAQLLASQEIQHKLEQQLRDSEAKRNQMLLEKQIMEQHLQETAGDLEFAERELSRRGSPTGTPPREDSEDGSPRQQTPSLRQVYADDPAHLKEENETIMEELVMCKMQLAELNESYLSTCHELHKSKEKNLAIAAKMTRLETIIYKHAESEAGTAEKLVQAKHSPAKSGKK